LEKIKQVVKTGEKEQVAARERERIGKKR